MADFKLVNNFVADYMHLGFKFLSFNGNLLLVLDRGVSGYNFLYNFLCV